MNVAILDSNKKIINVIVMDEVDFVESDTLKKCPEWCWIGDVYTIEKPTDYAGIEIDVLTTAYTNVSKGDILDMIAGLTEQVEALKGSTTK